MHPVRYDIGDDLYIATCELSMRVTVPSQIGIAGCDSGARGSSPLECGALAPLSWLRLAAATGSKLPAKSGGEPPHSKGRPDT